MSRRSKSFAISALLLSGACAPATPAMSGAGPGTAEVKNVIFMVTDGGGLAYWSAAELAADELAVEQMRVVGLVDTQSSDNRVTDSAASASVYATGVRTYNGAISVGPECKNLLMRDSVALKQNPSRCEPLESAFDVARRRGKALGVVTTTYVVDATPAAFVANAPLRYWRESIAEQFASAELDVLLGGGRQYFDAAVRSDRADLLGQMCARAACVTDARTLSAYRPDDRPLVGLFVPVNMAPAGERSPTLPQMVEAALSKLSRDPEGFVAVFETEGTDDAGHNNDPLETIVAEMLEFDQAVGEVLRFARRNPGTLVIVTADHETGGLALGLRGETLVATYPEVGGIGHTASMVPLFAFGPGAERFAGIHDNTDIGRMLKEVVAGR